MSLRARTRSVGPLLAVAGLCLLLGTTGGAVAAGLITGADIKDGTVTTKDVKDKTLKTGDLSPAAVDDLTGPRGLPGSPGAPGQVGYQQVTGLPASVSSEALATITAECPTGTTVLGGSYVDNPIGSATQVSGGPADFGGWQLRMSNPTASTITVTPRAICTRP